MTREDIIRMGQTAGILEPLGYTDPSLKNWRNDVLWKLERFALYVAAAKCEELAIEAERNGNTILAQQIRARGKA